MEQYYSPETTTDGSMYVQLGVFLDGVEEFDPAAFRLAAAEAMAMDPQSRLLLEQTTLALEDAKPAVGSLMGTFMT